ncbi:MAG: 4Fe-4S binding protein, partial [Acidilobus sp.]
VYVDYEYCKGCGICAEVCPTHAIEMVPEVVGEGQ